VASRYAFSASLGQVPLLAAAAPETRRRLVEVANSRRLASGAALFSAGQPAHALYAVLGGMMLLVGRTPQGRDVVAEMLPPRSVFGDSAILGREPHAISARAGAACHLAEIPVDAIEQACADDPAFASLMLRGLLHRMHTAPVDWISLIALPATRRVAAYLARQPATRADGSFRIPVRKGDIASYLQLANATFSRSVRVLQDASLIRLSGRWVCVPDRHALADFSRGRPVGRRAAMPFEQVSAPA